MNNFNLANIYVLLICATVIFTRTSVQQNGFFPWKKGNINFVLILIIFHTCASPVSSPSSIFSDICTLLCFLFSMLDFWSVCLCLYLENSWSLFTKAFHLCPVSFGALYISSLNNEVHEIRLDNATPLSVPRPLTMMYSVLCFLIFRFVRQIYKLPCS